MEKLFRCDCGAHIIEFDYTGANKEFDFEDLSVIIYDVYNPDTGRKYKNPKTSGDAVMMNNKYPKELDKFLAFMERVIKNRKKATRLMPIRNRESKYDRVINKALERIEELNKIEKEKLKKAKK